MATPMAKGDGLEKSALPNAGIDITIGGQPVVIKAYLIDGNNYVRLRDVMKLFDIYVGYDEQTRRIDIVTSLPYSE